MNTYRITKDKKWVANILASRVDWRGDGAIHFYNGDTYVAGVYPEGAEVFELRVNGEQVKIEKGDLCTR